MSRYLLVPADGLHTEIREIGLPRGLVTNAYDDMLHKAKDKKGLEKLLRDLKNIEIGRNESGLLMYRGKSVGGLNFEEAVLDLCNRRFKYCYESFYDLLNKFNIIF